ncbi:MAG: hypothetical protein FWC32_12035 [Firmicutes bacterium]|nr:hypothetical protein [Bacillota bacterium]
MESKSLNILLIENFPNLREKYLDEVGWQEGDSTGSHVVYGNVFTPYLTECITNKELQEIKKAFDFLEEILALNDDYGDNVIACSVIESVTYLLIEHDYLQLLLGDASKALFDEFKKATNWPMP